MKKAIVLMTVMAALAIPALAIQSVNGEIEAKGEIVEVSTQPATLTLKEAASPPEKSGVVRKFVVDEATQLTSRGEPIDIADIQPGARATVRYVVDSGKNIAKSIDVTTPATD
ncbi:MAG TPA: hypothetical protein VEK15_27040 [Vicinamibacteria bacterium]|nr:hypothetical protein [Vicinamibacteria bacterium]